MKTPRLFVALVVAIAASSSCPAQILSDLVKLKLERLEVSPDPVEPGGRLRVAVTVTAENVAMPIPQKWGRVTVRIDREAVSSINSSPLGGFSTIASTKTEVFHLRAPATPGNHTVKADVYVERGNKLQLADDGERTFLVGQKTETTKQQPPSRSTSQGRFLESEKSDLTNEHDIAVLSGTWKNTSGKEFTLGKDNTTSGIVGAESGKWTIREASNLYWMEEMEGKLVRVRRGGAGFPAIVIYDPASLRILKMLDITQGPSIAKESGAFYGLNVVSGDTVMILSPGMGAEAIVKVR